jgi:pimeloyl-ACP methyl ester carboxylesterase
MLYFPSVLSPAEANAMAVRSGLEHWYDGHGQFIGWKQLSKSTGLHDRVLITHGNAGSALDRADYARRLHEVLDCDLYILEYPGYGSRPGAPSQESLFKAGDEAVASLEREGPLYVIGESLGTGLAAYLAGTHPKPVTGLLLVAPYNTLGDVAQAHMPIFPARWMLRDKFESSRYLREYQGRVAVLLAGQDEVVPNRSGRKLYDDYSGPKKVWEIPGASHNDLPNQSTEWWKELVAFWKAQPSSAAVPPAD